MASLGTQVEFVSADTTVSFITSDPFGGEMVSALPYGEYNLVISKECFETDSSTVIVDCNDGAAISVFADLKEIVVSDSLAARICAGDVYIFGDQELFVSGQ